MALAFFGLLGVAFQARNAFAFLPRAPANKSANKSANKGGSSISPSTQVRSWRPMHGRFLLSQQPATASLSLSLSSSLAQRPGASSLAPSPYRVLSARPDGTPAWVVRRPQAPNPAAFNMAPNDAAEASAAFLRAESASLGLSEMDFEVGQVTALDGFTTVTFHQRFRGLPVLGGVVVFTYRAGELYSVRNEAFRFDLERVEPTLTGDEATAQALEALRAVDGSATLDDTEPAALEVCVLDEEPDSARLAYAVRLKGDAGRAGFVFHMDADDGTVLGVDELERYLAGRLRLSVEPTANGATPLPFSLANVSFDGGGGTDGDGDVAASGTYTFSYSGPGVRIADQSGRNLQRFSVAVEGDYRDYDLTPTDLSHADPFIHANIAQAFARTLTPNVPWLHRQLTTRVNANHMTCNAYWDGTYIVFFAAGGGCQNSGQIASVVYHEFGHGYHQALTSRVDGAIGEGSGDFYAAAILDDPRVGEGLLGGAQFLRDLSETRRYPQNYSGEVHNDGLIWGSAMWELRQAMIAKHGRWLGALLTNRIFVLALAQGPSLGTAYPAVISADDDDNDASNGSPNSCEINAIFADHGLIDGGNIGNTRVPASAFVKITHDAPGVFSPIFAPGRGGGGGGAVEITANTKNASSCGQYDVSTVKLHFARQSSPTAWETVPVEATGLSVKAVVEGLAEGEDFLYYFDIDVDGRTFSSGSADAPHTGHVAERGRRVLFEEGFEQGFGAFTPSAEAEGSASDWEVGRPRGLGFDPDQPHSGDSACGTDLGRVATVSGTDGLAKAGAKTFLDATTAIVTEGFEDLRLEFWHHYAVNGSLVVRVDDQEVYRVDSSGDDWSQGWRFVSVALPATTNDRADGVALRFEVDTGASNDLGGWTLDDVSVVGVALPPPPSTAVVAIEEVAASPLADQTVLPGEGGGHSGENTHGLSRSIGISGGCTCVRPPATSHMDLSWLGFGALALGSVWWIRARRRIARPGTSRSA
ncbi:MAG: M36 family metallopeptidase [Deltaproteobacteria bacterium]|nr:M36 family metallopeptidase [Deltaproteobacteria bacterium]